MNYGAVYVNGYGFASVLGRLFTCDSHLVPLPGITVLLQPDILQRRHCSSGMTSL